MIRARQEDRQPRRQKKENREKEEERRKTMAMSLLSQGQVGKAVRRITSHGVADMNDARVRQQMEEKYPDRGRQLPDSVPKGCCIDSMSGLKDVLLGSPQEQEVSVQSISHVWQRSGGSRRWNCWHSLV